MKLLMFGALLALTPPHVVPAIGWQVRTTNVHGCPGVKASRCSQATAAASTLRLRDCVECLPHRTVSAMKPGDTTVKVTVAIEHPTRARREFAWPPRITRRDVSAGFEGLPSRIGVYQGQTLVGKHEVLVFVVFGRAHPTDRQLQRANAELRRVRF
jgi:hypothetical protein